MKGSARGLIDRSVRLKVSLGVGLALIILLGPFNWIQFQFQRQAAINELSHLASMTGIVAVRSLEEAMLANNRRAVQAIVDSVSQAPDVRSVYLLDTNALVAASSGGLHNGVQLDRTNPLCFDCHQFPPAERPLSTVTTDEEGRPVFRTMTPVFNQASCQVCHSPQDRLNGVFYMDFSMTGLNSRLRSGLRNAFLTSGAIILGSTLVIYLLLSRLIITPLEQVVQAVSRFGRGQRQSRVQVEARDEMGLLADVFNDMADTIDAREAEADRLYTELKHKDEIRRQLLARLINAREEERRHLSREIHDELGQLLTGLGLNLKLSEQALEANPKKAAQHLAGANALVQHTIEQAHRLMVDLRPTVLDDYGLIPALEEELRQRLAPHGIESLLETDDDVSQLPPEIATAAFRIVQEALTNIIRHAQAQRVRVVVTRTVDELNVIVEDDGVGLPDEFVLAPDGRLPLGILGMKERAEALDGRLEVAPAQPRGTRIALWLPLERNVS